MERAAGHADRWIVVLWGGLLTATGLAQLGATIHVLVGTEESDGWDIGFGFLMGGYALAIGALLLAGRLDRKPLILPYGLWRYWLVLGLFLLGAVQLSVALHEPWPQWLREAPTLMFALGTWFFFVPSNHSASPPHLSEAKKRTWRRSITVVALAGIAVMVPVVALTMAGISTWAVTLLPFGLVLNAFAALMYRRASSAHLGAPPIPIRDDKGAPPWQ